MKKGLFATCADFAQKDVNALHGMIDSARKITYATLLKHCDLRAIPTSWGGILNTKDIELDCMDDCYKSKFKGKTCYYFVHSAIEFVFV